MDKYPFAAASIIGETDDQATHRQPTPFAFYHCSYGYPLGRIKVGQSRLGVATIFVFGLSSTLTDGQFAVSVTNTSALMAVLEAESTEEDELIT